ncbi:MAG: hypothetical protein HUJ79_06180 [Firmicutes bacterium]|nr:hypothetical protein [Bacillota bacterium]
MFFYETSVSQSHMHMALRCEAGQITGKTTTYDEDNSVADAGSLWDGTITTGRKGVFKNVEGSKDISMIARGVLYNRRTQNISDSAHAPDGVKYVRLKNSMTRGASGE